ncbi:MAG: transporter [Conexibacter sp.]|nr:transporter [Conexibacter sp.]
MSASTSATTVRIERRRRRFLRRLTLATAWGAALDGYDLGIISVVLPQIASELAIGPAWAGLIGASTLIGIFMGAPIFGLLTDRFGRHYPFLINIAAFVILGLAQAFVQNAGQLFAVRLLLGLAIGAEYAIGAPMLSEFSPADRRGALGAWLEACWYSGFLVSVIVGYVLLDVAGASWRLILASSAVPAVVTLILRHGLPESPRWLMSRGRRSEARSIALDVTGDESTFDAELGAEPTARGSVRELFSPAYRGRLLLVSGFWACLVAPYFAIVTFAPQVLTALGLGDARAGTIGTNAIAVAGAFTGMFIMDRVGRRAMLIAPFWICAGALAVVGLWPGGPLLAIAACFVTFAFFNALAADLCGVYPNELFPTHLRTTGVGIAAAASRIGAAIGTFLLPIGLTTIGVGPSMLVGAAFCVVGAVISRRWAPETAGVPLIEASSPARSGVPPRPQPQPEGASG